MWIGLIFLAIGNEAKEILPGSIGFLPIVQLPCVFFSAVLIPLGALMALRQFAEGHRRRAMLSIHVVGLVFVLSVLCLYFFFYLAMNRLVSIEIEMPDALPKLTQYARVLPDQNRRVWMAQDAYRQYGAIIAYRDDNQAVTFYVPTDADKAAWKEEEDIRATVRRRTDFILNLDTQFAYLFAVYAASSFATIAAGWIWLLARPPKDFAPLSS